MNKCFLLLIWKVRRSSLSKNIANHILNKSSLVKTEKSLRNTAIEFRWLLFIFFFMLLRARSSNPYISCQTSIIIIIDLTVSYWPTILSLKQTQHNVSYQLVRNFFKYHENNCGEVNPRRFQLLGNIKVLPYMLSEWKWKLDLLFMF